MYTPKLEYVSFCCQFLPIVHLESRMPAAVTDSRVRCALVMVYSKVRLPGYGVGNSSVPRIPG